MRSGGLAQSNRKSQLLNMKVGELREDTKQLAMQDKDTDHDFEHMVNDGHNYC